MMMMAYELDRGDWRYEFSVNLQQWMVGVNWGPTPGPMWNVFIGPLRLGGWKRL